MIETADILFYEPLEDRYQQSRVLDLFRRLPVRMALFRIFARDERRMFTKTAIRHAPGEDGADSAVIDAPGGRGGGGRGGRPGASHSNL